MPWVVGQCVKDLRDDGDQFLLGNRTDLLKPSERAGQPDTYQGRDGDLGPQFGTRHASPRHVSHQRVDEAAPDPLQRRNADLIGDVTTDKCLQDGPGPVLVGPGHDGICHLSQSAEAAGIWLAARILRRHRGDIEISLAAEVASDESRIDAGTLSNVTDRRTLESSLTEQLLGRLEKGLLTGRGIPGSTRLGGNGR